MDSGDHADFENKRLNSCEAEKKGRDEVTGDLNLIRPRSKSAELLDSSVCSQSTWLLKTETPTN
jgi:hypothetical protein